MKTVLIYVKPNRWLTIPKAQRSSMRSWSETLTIGSISASLGSLRLLARQPRKELARFWHFL
jgi:hypothetical protein